jgi:uncharacterized RDD family membrane protein YckC
MAVAKIGPREVASLIRRSPMVAASFAFILAGLLFGTVADAVGYQPTSGNIALALIMVSAVLYLIAGAPAIQRK